MKNIQDYVHAKFSICMKAFEVRNMAEIDIEELPNLIREVASDIEEEIKKYKKSHD